MILSGVWTCNDNDQYMGRSTKSKKGTRRAEKMNPRDNSLQNTRKDEKLIGSQGLQAGKNEIGDKYSLWHEHNDNETHTTRTWTGRNTRRNDRYGAPRGTRPDGALHKTARATTYKAQTHSNDVITADSLREVITTVLREATRIVGGEVFTGNPERRHRSCPAECCCPREANSEGGRRWDTEGTRNLGNDTKRQDREDREEFEEARGHAGMVRWKLVKRNGLPWANMGQRRPCARATMSADAKKDLLDVRSSGT
ncbi:hypothetical protein B0H11DRAFT_2366942 [Mycena galericulata]|nr:hypothetical protein B0H11DRAFT_2366942 [Mycena galericulata]